MWSQFYALVLHVCLQAPLFFLRERSLWWSWMEVPPCSCKLPRLVSPEKPVFQQMLAQPVADSQFPATHVSTLEMFLLMRRLVKHLVQDLESVLLRTCLWQPFLRCFDHLKFEMKLRGSDECHLYFWTLSKVIELTWNKNQFMDILCRENLYPCLIKSDYHQGYKI